MYYRVAIQVDQAPHWQWKSTLLSSLDAVFRWLRLYRAVPQDQLRVFSGSSREEVDRQLVRANQGQESGSTTAAQFLQERRLGLPGLPWGMAAQRERETGENQVRGPIAVSTLAASNQLSQRTPSPDERRMSAWEHRRLELESGAGGDHDCAYQFALPGSLPQALAWMMLLAKVLAGELEP